MRCTQNNAGERAYPLAPAMDTTGWQRPPAQGRLRRGWPAAVDLRWRLSLARRWRRPRWVQRRYFFAKALLRQRIFVEAPWELQPAVGAGPAPRSRRRCQAARASRSAADGTHQGTLAFGSTPAWRCMARRGARLISPATLAANDLRIPLFTADRRRCAGRARRRASRIQSRCVLHDGRIVRSMLPRRVGEPWPRHRCDMPVCEVRACDVPVGYLLSSKVWPRCAMVLCTT